MKACLSVWCVHLLATHAISRGVPIIGLAIGYQLYHPRNGITSATCVKMQIQKYSTYFKENMSRVVVLHVYIKICNLNLYI